MTVTPEQLQAQIVREIGDSDDGVLATEIADIWALYADKAPIAPRLQYLYAKRAAADTVMGAIRKNVDFVTPTLSVKLSQETERLQAIYDRVNEEIALVEKRASANRAPALTPLLTVAPEAPPPWWQGADANAARYRGDPYFRDLRRQIR